MAILPTVEEALQAAIGDYNNWASEKGRGYDPVRAYGELRGIFFNKLMARLRESGEIIVNRLRHRTVLPDDLACIFSNTTCELKGLVIPTASGNEDRLSILVLLSEYAGKADYKSTYSAPQHALVSPENKMTYIINSIKTYRK